MNKMTIVIILLAILVFCLVYKISELKSENQRLREENIYIRNFYENKPVKIVDNKTLKKGGQYWVSFSFSPADYTKTCKIEWVNPTTKEVEGYEVSTK